MRYKDILLVVLLFSCAESKEFTKVKYVHITSSTGEQIKVSYVLQIPKQYKLQIITASGEVGTEHQYWYPDSCLIYISDFANTENSNNIIRAGYTSKKLEYSMRQDFKNDTLNLSGKNEKGFYWKEITIGKLNLGYMNIPQENKEIFDKALSSIQRK